MRAVPSNSHLHSFEESFYILEGSVIVHIGARLCARSWPLRPDRHRHLARVAERGGRGPRAGWKCKRPAAAPWTTAQSSSSRGRGSPNCATAGPEGSQMPGRSATSTKGNYRVPARRPKWKDSTPTTGVAIKMFVDRSFGLIVSLADSEIETSLAPRSICTIIPSRNPRSHRGRASASQGRRPDLRVDPRRRDLDQRRSHS